MEDVYSNACLESDLSFVGDGFMSPIQNMKHTLPCLLVENFFGGNMPPFLVYFVVLVGFTGDTGQDRNHSCYMSMCR